MVPKSKPKLGAEGLNFARDITWERLILLSLSKERPKKHVSWQVHFKAGIICFKGGVHHSPQNSVSNVFWDTLYDEEIFIVQTVVTVAAHDSAVALNCCSV